MIEPADSICIGCGLCCNGTLHGRASVRPDDEANVIAAGLEIAEEGEARFFRQPCPQFACGTCSIYAQRPQVCRKYRCALLKRLEAGDVVESEAREKIAMAKELVTAVRSFDPDAVTPAGRTALVNRLKADLTLVDGAAREATAKTLLATAVLEHFLDRWFLKKKEPAGPSEPATRETKVVP